MVELKFSDSMLKQEARTKDRAEREKIIDLA